MYFNDDGTEVFPELFPKPQLCLSCKKNEQTDEEEILCNFTRLGQKNNLAFICYGYEPITWLVFESFIRFDTKN